MKFKFVIGITIIFVLATAVSFVSAQSIVPGLHGMSTVDGVRFTWLIISNNTDLSLNVRYNGTGVTPAILISATALTKSNQIQSIMAGSQVLNAGWISPASLTIKIEGDKSLNDADLITAVVSPYTGRNLTIAPQNNAEPINSAPTNVAQTTSETTTQTDCDYSSYPDFCIPSPPSQINCDQITQKNFRVLSPDSQGLDRNKNGIGCESTE